MRWYDATESLDGDAFNQWLDTFTDHVEQTRRSGTVVDGLQFTMPIEKMDLAWRDANIVPRYNAASSDSLSSCPPACPPSAPRRSEKDPPTSPPSTSGPRQAPDDGSPPERTADDAEAVRRRR
jgi:hypothetical protein